MPSRYQPTRYLHRWDDSHWAHILAQAVTEDGYVRYDLLMADAGGVREALFRYVGLIQRASPANRPDLFPGESDKLAYYLNAYNALALHGALRRGLPQNIYLSGVLQNQNVVIGNRTMTLEELENRIIRPFGDPRVHFAINWMSRSSPPLRKEPYEGTLLDEQLEEQGLRLLSDPRAVRPVDSDTIQLSELFTRFYPQDFMAAFERQTGARAVSIVEALRPYAGDDSLVQTAEDYVTLPFDWSLNAAR